jgi:hypothetical protein
VQDERPQNATRPRDRGPQPPNTRIIAVSSLTASEDSNASCTENLSAACTTRGAQRSLPIDDDGARRILSGRGVPELALTVATPAL